MGEACSKQFDNIPEEELSPGQVLNLTVVSQLHQTAKPSTATLPIGFIQSTVLNTHSLAVNPGNNSLNPNLNPGKRLDKQFLHSTVNPFKEPELLTLNITRFEPSRTFLRKERQQLTLDFYHSLGLPEYSYRPIPPEHEYTNLKLQQQVDRNGVRYIGEWTDKPHGNGVMQSNTTKYMGQFRNGLKHFHGREIEADEVYEGDYYQGLRKGQGVRYTPFATEKGEFDGLMINGEIDYANGDKYKGHLKDGQYHDQKGMLYVQEKKIKYEGRFDHGMLEGEVQLTYGQSLQHSQRHYFIHGQIQKKTSGNARSQPSYQEESEESSDAYGLPPMWRKALFGTLSQAPSQNQTSEIPGELKQLSGLVNNEPLSTAL